MIKVTVTDHNDNGTVYVRSFYHRNPGTVASHDWARESMLKVLDLGDHRLTIETETL